MPVKVYKGLTICILSVSAIHWYGNKSTEQFCLATLHSAISSFLMPFLLSLNSKYVIIMFVHFSNVLVSQSVGVNSEMDV